MTRPSDSASTPVRPAKTKAAPVTKPTAPPQSKTKPAAAKPKAAPAAAQAVAEEKAKKVKLVRDSFTMPKNEYQQIDELKLALAKQGRPAKKSELLRAGLMLLSKQTPGALLACVDALAPVKTGRPKKN